MARACLSTLVVERSLCFFNTFFAVVIAGSSSARTYTKPPLEPLS